MGFNGVGVVRPRGLEPLTYGLEGRCSIQLSYERITIKERLEFWYQRGDLNPRPPAYETSALNQLSYLGVPKNKDWILQSYTLKYNKILTDCVNLRITAINCVAKLP